MEVAIACLALTIAVVLFLSVRFWGTKTPPRLDQREGEEPVAAQARRHLR